jgi:hypothetical protein
MLERRRDRIPPQLETMTTTEAADLHHSAARHGLLNDGGVLTQIAG